MQVRNIGGSRPGMSCRVGEERRPREWRGREKARARARGRERDRERQRETERGAEVAEETCREANTRKWPLATDACGLKLLIKLLIKRLRRRPVARRQVESLNRALIEP